MHKKMAKYLQKCMEELKNDNDWLSYITNGECKNIKSNHIIRLEAFLDSVINYNEILHLLKYENNINLFPRVDVFMTTLKDCNSHEFESCKRKIQIIKKQSDVNNNNVIIGLNEKDDFDVDKISRIYDLLKNQKNEIEGLSNDKLYSTFFDDKLPILIDLTEKTFECLHQYRDNNISILMNCLEEMKNVLDNYVGEESLNIIKDELTSFKDVVLKLGLYITEVNEGEVYDSKYMEDINGLRNVTAVVDRVYSQGYGMLNYNGTVDIDVSALVDIHIQDKVINKDIQNGFMFILSETIKIFKSFLKYKEKIRMTTITDEQQSKMSEYSISIQRLIDEYKFSELKRIPKYLIEMNELVYGVNQFEENIESFKQRIDSIKDVLTT